MVTFKRTKDVFERGFKVLDLQKATSFYSKKDMAVALAYSDLKPEEKSVAASVMFHIMRFAHDVAPSQQNAIDWGHADLLNYNICAPATDPAEPTSVLGTANPSAFTEEYNHEPTITDEPDEIKIMKKKDSKKPKPVKRIDPKTGSVIVYESISAAQNATGIKNIARSIESKGKAGGYTWEYATNEDVDHKLTEVLHAPAQVDPEESVASRKQLLRECTNQELINEIRRRGWKGDIEVVEKVKL